MKSGLATWVAGQAEQRGQLETAQQAWRVAFADEPSVDAYENLKRLSGDDWQGLRPELLARAEEGGRSDVMIKIVIADHDIERAIQLWERTATVTMNCWINWSQWRRKRTPIGRHNRPSRKRES